MLRLLLDSELTYIHVPSGDHAANKHLAPGGPICRPVELPSVRIRRHGVKRPRSVISATSAQPPSGDGYDRCAIAPFGIGTYRSRAAARLSSAATIFMWLPSLPLIFSEKSSFCLSSQINPDAFGSHRRGSPPSTGTTQVSHSFCASTVV